MILMVLPGQGLVIDQAPLDASDLPGRVDQVKARHAAAVEEAEDWLAGQGMDPWDIAELGLPGRVRRLMYHDQVGFVPLGWEGEGARPVLIVHVPIAEQPDVPPDVEIIPPEQPEEPNA